MNPQIVEWFGEYAKLLAERFSDRVKYFFTLNEPQCFVGLGFFLASGRCEKLALECDLVVGSDTFRKISRRRTGEVMSRIFLRLQKKICV